MHSENIQWVRIFYFFNNQKIWNSGLYLFSHSLTNLIRRFSTFYWSTWTSRLHTQQSFKELLHVLLLEGDVRISMQTINLRIIFEWKSTNIFFHSFKFKINWIMIDSWTRETIFSFHHIGIEITQEKSSNQSYVLVISYSTTIVYFSN